MMRSATKTGDELELLCIIQPLHKGKYREIKFTLPLS